LVRKNIGDTVDKVNAHDESTLPKKRGERDSA